MKITRRPAAARGQTELGWLHSQHTFSFGEYRDPAHMGFRKLRVLNDDVVEPGQGFGTHGHKDAEILSYVLEGRLEHKDSMGNGSIIETGALQYMSAGSGVTHSEFNPSRSERVHFLQIWILPDGTGGDPRYAEKQLPSETKPNSLNLVFSGNPRDGAIAIRADADVYLGRLDAGRKLVHETRPGRGLWIQVVDGDVAVGGTRLEAGDGASIEDAAKLELESAGGTELLLFDLR
ncbi:MAG: pirin family protein [Deltaproteobacteria bacterium]|nr:pirin family protein [Deltaproteobacteria bacterium]